MSAAYASTFGTDSQFYPTYPDNMYEATLYNQQSGCIIIWDSANNQIDPSNRVIFNKHASGQVVSSRRRLCCADPPASGRRRHQCRRRRGVLRCWIKLRGCCWQR